MDGKKIALGTVGYTLKTAGVAAGLVKAGLHASEIVLNGAANLAGSFANTSIKGIGSAVFGEIQTQTGKLSNYLMKKGDSLIK
jgi:hypothetical protein